MILSSLFDGFPPSIMNCHHSIFVIRNENTSDVTRMEMSTGERKVADENFGTKCHSEEDFKTGSWKFAGKITPNIFLTLLWHRFVIFLLTLLLQHWERFFILFLDLVFVHAQSVLIRNMSPNMVSQVLWYFREIPYMVIIHKSCRLCRFSCYLYNLLNWPTGLLRSPEGLSSCSKIA